jgi:hypothetical protein
MTEEEKYKWDMQAMGCSRKELEDYAEDAISSPKMLIMSILSDAQEELNMDHKDTARQFINRAKHLIGKEMDYAN